MILSFHYTSLTANLIGLALKNISRIQQFLTTLTLSLAKDIITTIWVTANGLFLVSLLPYNLFFKQYVATMPFKKYRSINPLLKAPFWFPIQLRVKDKASAMRYEDLSDLASLLFKLHAYHYSLMCSSQT